MDRKKKRGRLESLIGAVFILTLFVVMLINILVPDRKRSEEESRMLATRPSLSWSNIMSGDFMEKFEAYMADQFVGRDAMRQVKVTADRIGGAKMEGDIYIGKNGQLMEDIEVADQEHLTANLEAIQNFSANYQDVPVNMLLVPDAACVLSDRLPAFASVEDQKQMISMVRKELGDSVNWIDAVSVLNKHKNEKIYYMTDQHWTALGAFYTFQEAASALGIEEDVSDKYVSYVVSDNFNGMLASRSGVGLDQREKIEIYVPKEGDDDVIVDYVDEGRRSTSLYDSSKLEERDEYSVYLGEDTSVLDIRTVSTSTKRLLVIKDSFADCFIPFLTPYYREIIVVDPRYYSGTIDDIMNTYRITDALILYSGNSFFKDNNINGVFTGE